MMPVTVVLEAVGTVGGPLEFRLQFTLVTSSLPANFMAYLWRHNMGGCTLSLFVNCSSLGVEVHTQ